MTDFDHIAELWFLRATIANSPIRVTASKAPARDFAEWCEQQEPADIDAVILGWLRSQTPQLAAH